MHYGVYVYVMSYIENNTHYLSRCIYIHYNNVYYIRIDTANFRTVT